MTSWIWQVKDAATTYDYQKDIWPHGVMTEMV